MSSFDFKAFLERQRAVNASTEDVAIERVEPLVPDLVEHRAEIVAKRLERQRKAALIPYKPARDEKGRLLPGNTANTLGRPPSVVTYLYAMTSGGMEMIDHALGIMRGYFVVQMPDSSGALRPSFFPSDAKSQAEARSFLVKECGLTAEFIERQAKQEQQEERIDHTLLTYAEVCDLERLLVKAGGDQQGPQKKQEFSRLTHAELKLYVILRQKTMAEPFVDDDLILHARRVVEEAELRAQDAAALSPASTKTRSNRNDHACPTPA